MRCFELSSMLTRWLNCYSILVKLCLKWQLIAWPACNTGINKKLPLMPLLVYILNDNFFVLHMWCFELTFMLTRWLNCQSILVKLWLEWQLIAWPDCNKCTNKKLALMLLLVTYLTITFCIKMISSLGSYLFYLSNG